MTEQNIGNFPINQMVLMLVNNKIKTEMEKQMKRELRMKKNMNKNESEAEEINKLILNLSLIHI